MDFRNVGGRRRSRIRDLSEEQCSSFPAPLQSTIRTSPKTRILSLVDCPKSYFLAWLAGRALPDIASGFFAHQIFVLFDLDFACGRIAGEADYDCVSSE